MLHRKRQDASALPCPGCGYDLRGSLPVTPDQQVTCPECGAISKMHDVVRACENRPAPIGWGWWLAAITPALLFIGGFALVLSTDVPPLDPLTLFPPFAMLSLALLCAVGWRFSQSSPPLPYRVLETAGWTVGLIIVNTAVVEMIFAVWAIAGVL